jgi:hypothetical protein
MPIHRLFRDHAFTPGHIQAMSTAFDQALDKLGLKDRSDPLVELVAKKIIQLGQDGERDSDKLRDRAIALLSSSETT